MANILTNNSWNDLGKFKKLERSVILNKTVYKLIFEEGELVLGDREKREITKLMVLYN